MKKIMHWFFKIKIFIYKKYLSNSKNVVGFPIFKQPSLFLGNGTINFAENVMLGYFPSPNFYSGDIHIEARDEGSIISFGKDVIISNNFTAIAYNASITILDNCLIGHDVEILSSDFHNIEPNHRRGSSKKPLSGHVKIGNNVWIGNSVKILKGVEIGDNCVVAAGSVVVKSVPENTIVAGNPAREVKKI
jgi:maltose O-acetyltransferase